MSFGVSLTIGILEFFSFFYTVITFPVYAIIQRPWNRRTLSRRVKAKAISQNKSQITYRSLSGPTDLHKEIILKNKLDTLEKVWNYVVKEKTTAKCLGTRRILAEVDEVQPNGQIMKKLKMGDYVWRDFIETNRDVLNFGKGIRELGVKARSNVAIFAETRAEWMISAHGLFKHACSIVTIYATLGDEAIAHCINQTEVEFLITSHELMPKIRKLLNQFPKLKNIIYFEHQIHTTDTSGFGDINVYSFEDVLKRGMTSEIDSTPPVEEDIAIIMFTSGSTGVPKGVLLSHGNCLATMKNFIDAASRDDKVMPDDILIAFLPLAHVFELVAENACFVVGITMGYSSPATLLDSSPMIMAGAKGDAAILKPTIMTCVPLILDRILKGINDKVSKSSTIQRAIFTFANRYKVRWTRRGYSTPLADKIVFKKIQAVVGGRIRLFASGGAPLSAETHEQVKLCLCVDVLQGYGLTETSAGATITCKYDLNYGRAGYPSGSSDVRLENWEEGGYRVTNKPYPQGEIIVGGTNVAQGYYKLPDQTNEAFFVEDGKRWMRTGDVGEIHEDGTLKIIDRKKDLVKLQAGEYVSLGKVETEMKLCPIVENICVIALPSKNHVIAVVAPNEKILGEVAESMAIRGDFKSLCANTTLQKVILKDITEHGKKYKLFKFEIPTAIIVSDEPWTPESDLVTSAFKIKRKEVFAKYKNEINIIYPA
ncbi:CLUMA_CG017401, isoform A [Clunio marinus]|uniref:long-chain-fatty-acid--CoA ligase n=1 Tax=Clunio marinus TaxID=568069 RepID=A0A1J1IVV0_9DIPT|nr:CLUMA_CG017401, isoform A [Clunio marinus]